MMSGRHSTVFGSKGMPTGVSSGTTRWIIRNTVGSRMIRHRIALMLGIVHLAGMGGRVMHVGRWTTHHMWITRVIVVRSPVVSMRKIVMTLHNWIWLITISVIVLPVRTWIVHLGCLLWNGLSICNCWSPMDPMTTI